MNCTRSIKLSFVALVVVTVMFTLRAGAQGPAERSIATPGNAETLPDPPPAPTPQFGGNPNPGDSWHGTVSIYGWFPGIHGTVGVLGHDASVHAPFSDVFHFLKGVIPIAVEVDRGRFSMGLISFG